MRQMYLILAALILVGLCATPVMAATVVPGGTTPYAWYRADMGVSTVGGGDNTVTGWADQSGNARDITTVKGDPQLEERNPGKTVISFDPLDGSYDGMTSSRTDWGTAAPGTVITVWQRRAVSGDVFGVEPIHGYEVLYDKYWDGNLAYNRQILGLWGDTASPDPDDLTFLQFGSENGNYHFLAPDPAADPIGSEMWAVSASSYTSSTSSKMYCDQLRDAETFDLSAALLASGDSLSGGMNGITIGTAAKMEDNGNFYGDIAELIVFEGDLSDTELIAIMADLHERWYPVPEPGSLLLCLSGMLALAFCTLIKRK